MSPFVYDQNFSTLTILCEFNNDESWQTEYVEFEFLH